MVKSTNSVGMMDLIELEFVSGANNNIKPSNDVPWRVLVIASEWYDDLLENWLYWFDKLYPVTKAQLLARVICKKAEDKY